MQYVAFDYFFWVLTAYFVVRLLKSEDPRWWLAIGASIGFGMLTKYTMGFFVFAIVGALVLTSSRRYLKSKWLWYGVALSILVLLPNLLWQARHHFVSLAFLHYIHSRDVRQGHTKYFLPDQLRYTIFTVPLWFSGLQLSISFPLKALASVCSAGCTSSPSRCSSSPRAAAITCFLGIPCFTPLAVCTGSSGWLLCAEVRQWPSAFWPGPRTFCQHPPSHPLLYASQPHQLPLMEHRKRGQRRFARRTWLGRAHANHCANPRLSHTR